MIHFVFFSEFVKVFTPYIRKPLLLTMEPFECMFLNSIVVLILCLLLLLFKVVFKKHNPKDTIKKFSSMNIAHIGLALLIGIATIIASMTILTFDKHYNTPLINSMLFKIVSVILLIITGVTLFNEKYSYKQILGLIFVIIGGVLVFYKNGTVYITRE